jgi:hypothetical protein
MSSGKETMWLVGLFVLVVIILGIVFKPFGEYLSKAPVEAVNTIHNIVTSGQSTLARVSLDGRGSCHSKTGNSCDTRKDSFQQHVFSKVSDAVVSTRQANDPLLLSTPYSQNNHTGGGGGVNKRNAYSSSQTININNINKRVDKDINYNSLTRSSPSGVYTTSMAGGKYIAYNRYNQDGIDTTSTEEDKNVYSTLGSDNDFTHPYGKAKKQILKTSHPVNYKAADPVMSYVNTAGVVEPTL